MSSKTEYFSRVVEVSEDKKDRSGNSYRTIRIECTPAVQRQNPFTKEMETCPGVARVFTINSWQEGVDSPWNHIYNMPVGTPVLGTQVKLDVEPYEIDERTYTTATILVPDTEDSPSWGRSLDRMLRWDDFTPAGSFVPPINVIEETVTEESTEEEEVTLDI